MKYALIVLLAFILSVTSVVATETLELNEGWNIVSIHAIPGVFEGHDGFIDNNVQYAYFANPFYESELAQPWYGNFYFAMYPGDPSLLVGFRNWLGYQMYDDPEFYNYETFQASSMWIYVTQDTTVEMPEVDPNPLDNIILREGFNFLSVTHEMIGFNVLDFKGDCDLDVVYNFEGTWWPYADGNLDIVAEDYGKGLLFKSNNQCSFVSPEVIVPPQLP